MSSCGCRCHKENASHDGRGPICCADGTVDVLIEGRPLVSGALKATVTQSGMGK